MTALTIDRVAVRGGRRVAPRRRALARLERADPAAPGAPSEVLIIRRLDDPAPGALGRAIGRDGPAEWNRALAARLSEMHARAARPARGATALGTEAVLFADEAEMLACLVETLADGRSRPWWARVAARRLPPGGGVADLLAHRPFLLPALTELLVARGSALRVFSALTPIESETLARVAGLPTPAQIVPGELARVQQAGSGPVFVDTRLAGPLAALPEAPAGLLAACWVRRRHPVLRPGAITRAAAALLRHARAPTGPAAPDPRSGPPGHATEDPRKESPAATPRRPKGRAPGTDPPETEAPPHADAARREPGQPRDDDPQRPRFRAPNRVQRDTAAPERKTVPRPTRDAQARSTADAANGVATRLGGVIFLVNLFHGRLSARAPSLGVALDGAACAADGPWTALERLARALLGDPDPEDAADALWRLLATLDNRAPDDPVLPGPADRAAARAATTVIAHAGWETPPAASAVAGLLRVPARVFAAPLHLDVMMPGEAVSLPVRRAGLDLDPGWQPRFGRVIAFHYRDEGWP